MEAKHIADLIQKGHEALDSGDAKSAKLFALKAIAGTNNEKDKFLTGLNVTVTEQQLADWYGGCSFILNQIGEDMTAARCFYTATIFDPQWNVQNHIAVSDVLWGSLVFFISLPVRSLNIQKIRGFLAELDGLAKLAERRKKWSVCVAIDGDINKIYSFLKRIALGPRDIIAEPGRKTAIWRSARCYLELNLHQEVRKVCSTILQHVCDYDDHEALAIWARSLFLTGDYDLAFQKNELALKYCQDGGYRDRLQTFKSKIQEKLASASPPQREPDEEWLEGTNVNKAIATDKSHHSDADRRKKKRHKRPKAIDRSGQSTPFSRAQSLDGITVLRSSSRTPFRVTQNASGTIKTINSGVERLKLEGSGKNRSRNVSSCSTTTTATDASGFGTETSYDYSVSDSDSNDDSSINYAASSRTESPDLNFMSEQDIEIDSIQEKMSFYEQSCRFYQQNDEVSKNLGRAETEENF